MRTMVCGALLGGALAFLGGCGADVDGGSGTFVGEADLSGSVSGPATVTPGSVSDWTFTVSNAGPEPAADVPVDLSLAPASAVEGILEPGLRWTCEATSGSCAATEGRGDPDTSVSLDSGGTAVITVRVPLAWDTEAGIPIEASIEVGEDGTWPDPNTTDNTASADAVTGERPEVADFSDEIIYWAFTDRFANGDPSNDNGNSDRDGDEANPADAIAWHGGDFAGIRQKIEEGYFQGMGFTAIWISPVIVQVPALDNGNAAYHGYWPELSLEIEPHFGTEAELRALVETAHANDLKIILDVVANHVGFDAQAAITDPDYVRTGTECGPADNPETLCLAGLPDLIQENSEVTMLLLDGLSQLVTSTGVDGIRWDAMKHVNAEFWVQAFEPGAPADRSAFWSMGEVFETGTGPIAFYLDSVGAPSVLDFPLYSAINDSLSGAGWSRRLSQVLRQDEVYSDPRRLTTFLDNHDVMRFVSQNLTRVGDATRDTALERLDMALSFLYANRGIPVVYYGTEIGMEGLGDPFQFRDGNSNREDMDFAAAGDPSVTSCAVADQGLDNSEAYGTAVYLRGAFNDWADPPPAEAQLFNSGGGVYAQALQLAAGSYGFKIAAADWSVERTNDAVAVMPGTPVTLNTSGGNTNLEVAQDGCYRFDLDGSGSTDNPALSVSRLEVAAPLAQRLAALAQARNDYPALRDGMQTLLYDTNQQCTIPSMQVAPEDVFGQTLYMRGAFNDWADPPPGEAGFVQTGDTTYEAEFQVGAGSHGYKVAYADWSLERAVLGEDTVPGAGAQPLTDPGPGGPNGNLVVAADACLNFTLDASDLDALTLAVSEDTDGTCAVELDDPDAAAFGRKVYLRGTFNDWADPPPESDGFVATGPGQLEALVAIESIEEGEDAPQYKIASADWTVERAVVGRPTVLDTPQLLGVPSGNGTFPLEEGDCFRWAIDASDPDAAMLTVTREDIGGDVFALRRDLENEASVILVLNNHGEAADLGALGGIPADGFPDGPAIEITGRASDLAVSGGRIVGTVPPRTAYLVGSE